MSAKPNSSVNGIATINNIATIIQIILSKIFNRAFIYPTAAIPKNKIAMTAFIQM